MEIETEIEPDDFNPLAAAGKAAVETPRAEREEDSQTRADKLKIQRIAQLAAGREAAKLRRQHEKDAEAKDPDKPVAEVARLRSAMANLVPDSTHLKISKIIDGHVIWVGDYNGRDAQAANGDLNKFIATRLYPKHKCTAWQVVFTSADNKERAPILVNIDPDPESREVGNNGIAAKLILDELKELKRPQGNPINDTIDMMGKVREMFGNEGGAIDPITMLMIRDMIKPAPVDDGRIARLEAQVMAFINTPPSSPISLAPTSDPNALVIAMMADARAAQAASDLRHENAMRRMEEQRREEARMLREDLKDARDAARKGGNGYGVDAFLEMKAKLKAAGLDGNDEGSDFAKLASAVKDTVAMLTKTKQPEAAQLSAPPAAAPEMNIDFPEGFEEKAKTIGLATTDPERVAAMLECYQFLVEKGGKFWGFFHQKVVGYAKKGEAAEVRKYVDGMLESLEKSISPEQRQAAMVAYDTHADKIVSMLAAS